MDTVAINYQVVGAQVDEMGQLVTDAQKLQGGLDDLKATITSNWQGADSDFLMNNYPEFIKNIEEITKDINNVASWCVETTNGFKATVAANQEKVAAAYSGR